MVRQLVQEGGFHEDDLEFATLPITLICTADSSPKLHPRLSALLSAHHLPYPSSKDITNIVEVHLKNSLADVKLINDSWISQLASSMYEALVEISASKESTFTWTPKDLTLWAECLKKYPVPENTSEIIRCLLDAGERLFYPK